jgi:type IV pilus assembly protein PilV
MKFSRRAGQVCGVSRGVTLIEVLVTLLVVSIGLLGVAALQIYSLQSSQVSAQRTMALNLAAQITDDWRTNRAFCTGTAQLPEPVRDRWARYFSSSTGDTTVFLPGGTALATCDANQVVTVTISWPTGRFEEEFAEADADRLDEVTLVTRI